MNLLLKLLALLTLLVSFDINPAVTERVYQTCLQQCQRRSVQQSIGTTACEDDCAEAKSGGGPL